MTETDTKAKKKGNNAGRFLLVLTICFAALLSLSFIVHIPVVQAWGIKRITNFLSAKAETRVDVHRFDFNIFSHLQLSDVYFESPFDNQDTLIHAERLTVRFANLLSLMRNRLRLREVEFHGATINILRQETGEMSDFSLVAQRLFTRGPDTVSTNARLILRVDKFDASDLHLRYRDLGKGSTQTFELSRAIVDFDVIDFEKKLLSIQSIGLEGADVSIHETQTQGETAKEPVKSIRDSVQWRIKVGRFTLNEGDFAYLHDMKKRGADTGIDYADLDLSDIVLDIRDLRVAGMDISADVRQLSFQDKSGFTLSGLEARRVQVTNEEIGLLNMELQTPHSTISDTLRFAFSGFSDFGNFANQVEIYGTFDGTRIAISDLMLLIPDLQENEIFQQNAEGVITLDGVVMNRVNRLRGDNIRMQLGDIIFRGSFRSRNLTVPGEQILNLDVDEALFSAAELNKHIPGITLPDQFRKLGKVHFSGRFDGFFQDFVTDGKIRTNLGTSSMDMRLDLKPGLRQARYSGKIELVNFELGRWTDNPDLGTISAVGQVREGVGLTADAARATLEGTIGSLTYKDYVYRNVLLNGVVDQNFFDGSLVMRDENVHINFLGEADFRDSVPSFDFSADVDTLDLYALNLVEVPLSLAGNFVVEGSGKDPASMTGRAYARNVRIRRDTSYYELDSVNISSESLTPENRSIQIYSDYITGTASGNFEFRTLYPTITQYLESHFPRYLKNIHKPTDTLTSKPHFTFDITLNKPEDWIGLLDLDSIGFRDLSLSGEINMLQDSLRIAVGVPEFHLKDYNAYNVKGNLWAHEDQAGTRWNMVVGDYREEYFLDEVSVDLFMHDQVVDWHFIAEDVLEAINSIDVSGTYAQTEEERHTLTVAPREIALFNRNWQLHPGNRLSWEDGYVRLDSMIFMSNGQFLVLDDLDTRGLMVEMKGFDASYIDEVWDYDKLNFSGNYHFIASVDDIFKRTGFDVVLNIPDFRVNDDSYGVLNIDGRMDALGDPVLLSVTMDKPGSRVDVEGSYYPPLDEVRDDLKNDIGGTVKIDSFPLAFLEYIIGDGIENTEGKILAEVEVTGNTRDIKMEGSGKIYDGATTVKYLGTRYTFDDQTINLNSDVIDLTGVVIRDMVGNTATIEGGLTHRYLVDIGLNVRLRSPRFVGLNTTPESDEQYYGFGIGALDVRFTGTTQRPNISVDATTSAGTFLAIPVGSGSTGTRESFIRFVDRDTITAGSLREPTVITGVNFDMNLTLTPDALVEIIFDERTDEILKGSGQGDIRLSITRAGDLSMYGAFRVEEGDYTFNLAVIKKPFEIEEGSTIRWSGDPLLDAEMDIVAYYTGIRTSLSTFLEEYLISASDDAHEEANIKTEVVLQLHLSGSLLAPNINFDISFPDLSGELAGYADSKLRILKSNQNALNEQVFGLLWVGTFLPSNALQSQSTAQIARSGFETTLSQWVSNQLSSFLSTFLERAVSDVGFISGIDFNVGYTAKSDLISEEYQEWELRPKFRLFDDRFIVEGGTNVAKDNPIAEGAYVAYDYALEYVLTSDRRLKVRFYQRTGVETIEGRKNKVGIGLSYRREFDSFGEWLKGLDKAAKTAVEGTPSEEGQVN